MKVTLIGFLPEYSACFSFNFSVDFENFNVNLSVKGKMVVFAKEKQIESFLRSNSWVLFVVSVVTASSLYAGIGICLRLYLNGHHWSIIPAGLLAHAFFVITMHDGAHKSLTRTKFDYVIMNVCAGLIVIPFYTELFKKYHLLHHANTNTDHDPLWSPLKEKMFKEQRYLYAVLQCIPFAFNLAAVLSYNKGRGKDKTNQPTVSISQMVLSLVVALGVLYFIEPSLLFIIGTISIMTSLGAVRYWAEHMGTAKGIESNTHWFPLGMGIGNHNVHHHYPGYSWLSLTIGSWFRKKDTNPLKTMYGMLFLKSFKHYPSIQRKGISC